MKTETASSAAPLGPGMIDRHVPEIRGEKPAQQRRAATVMFLTAWAFFAIAAAIGLLLRMQFVFPLSGFAYGNFLHTHSHIAFLGWVYNAFFALAVWYFVPANAVRAYWRLFLVTQVAVVGILVSFPLQGYGWASIIFSTMHMVCAAAFIIKLLRRNTAGPAAKLYLWGASLFMLASSLGPLALAPIMAAGLSGSAWYESAIGYYLHFQYNGWFLFFLMAVFLQAAHEREASLADTAAGRAFPWLVAGCILTFSLSLLPMAPVLPMFLAAGAGGLAQLVGCVFFFQSIRAGARMFNSKTAAIVRWLATGALALFLLKVVLQALAAFPALLPLATSHFTIIAFMHLVFLGVVTPMLLAWAFKLGWLRLHTPVITGLGLLAGGALLSQLALGYAPIAGALGWANWPRFGETQFLAACLIFGGAALLALGATSRFAPDASGSRTRERQSIPGTTGKLDLCHRR